MPPASNSRIEKRFGAVHANKAVDLAVARGAIHGIVGGERGRQIDPDVDPVRLLRSRFRRDPGQWRAARIRSSADAIRAGIGMVHQHFMLVETLTVVENVMLGAEGGALLAGGAAKARAAMARSRGGRARDRPDALSATSRSGCRSASRSSRR
jgi:simple sugar transport system ATP-binding protein